MKRFTKRMSAAPKKMRPQFFDSVVCNECCWLAGCWMATRTKLNIAPIGCRFFLLSVCCSVLGGFCSLSLIGIFVVSFATEIISCQKHNVRCSSFAGLFALSVFLSHSHSLMMMCSTVNTMRMRIELFPHRMITVNSM